MCNFMTTESNKTSISKKTISKQFNYVVSHDKVNPPAEIGRAHV